MATDSNSTRTYVVLRLDEDGGWRVLTEVSAHTAKAACLKAAQELEPAELNQGIELTAVHARAWNAGHQRLIARHETRIVPT